MAFLDRFFRKQKKERLEKESEKQQQASGPAGLKVRKETAKDLELAKKTQKQIIKEEKKQTVKIGTKRIKPKFKINVHDILIKPLITEKISNMAVFGKYAFSVSPEANKIMVKKAVSTLYGVKVKDVKIINVRGKRVRHGRQWGKRKDWRKAIVLLAPGEKIEIYEGV